VGSQAAGGAVDHGLDSVPGQRTTVAVPARDFLLGLLTEHLRMSACDRAHDRVVDGDGGAGRGDEQLGLELALRELLVELSDEALEVRAAVCTRIEVGRGCLGTGRSGRRSAQPPREPAADRADVTDALHGSFASDLAPLPDPVKDLGHGSVQANDRVLVQVTDAPGVCMKDRRRTAVPTACEVTGDHLVLGCSPRMHTSAAAPPNMDRKRLPAP